jgi:hypothetical protein
MDKDTLFKKYLEDDQDKIQDGMNHWLYLLSLAFDYGYAMGLADSKEAELNAKDIPQSENVE